jgi:hypothetical protein
LLFIVMFLPWFGIGGAAGDALEQAQDLGFAAEVDTSANAWQSFDFIDLVLLVTIVVAVGLALTTMAARTVALPVAASAITAALGILSALLVLYRIIDPPSDAAREIWVFVGLVLTAAIAYGGWHAMQEEGSSFGGEADRLGDRLGGGGDPPPPPPPSAPPSGGPPSGGTGT